MTSVLLATATLLGVLAVGVVLLARNQLSNRVPFDKSPVVLVDRAQQALAALGYGSVPVDTHWGFYTEDDYLQYVREHADYARARDPFATRPNGLVFYYRTSPRRMVPYNIVGAVSLSDPPLVITDMTMVAMDPLGRLDWFHAIPPQHDPQAAPASPPDWNVVFRLAGLDQARFAPATPEWLPRGQADTRMAWTGTSADRPETPLRLEAASWRGRITFIQTVWPWTRATRMQEAPVSQAMRVMSAVNVAFFFVLLIAALIVSRKNVKAGRGDHRGALRLVTIAAVGQLITWVFNDPHGGDPQTELNRFFQTVGEALFAGGLLYVMYLALEPAVRRYWPDSLLGWTRLVQGQVLDARVGRDVLVGLAGGALMVVLFGIRWPLHAAFGHDGPIVEMGNLRVFEGPGYVLGLFSSLLAFQSTFNAMWCVFAIVGLKRLLKRMWLVAIAASLFFTFVAASGMYTDQPGFFWLNFATAVAVVSVVVVMAIRFGLLAAAVTFLVTNWTTNIPWTTATDRWDFPLSALAFGLLAAVAVFGAWAARTAVAPGHRDAERI